MRFSSVALLSLLAAAASAQEVKVLSKTHDATKSHAAIEDELKKEQHVTFPKAESFTCTLTGASFLFLLLNNKTPTLQQL